MFFCLDTNLTKWFGVAKRMKKDHFVLCFSLMKSTKIASVLVVKFKGVGESTDFKAWKVQLKFSSKA